MIPREILSRVRQIEIRTQKVLNAVLAGEYKSVFKGRGMEFSEVRTYVDGDDVRTIDWNVTARMGEPYVKKHVEERELTVMLVVDASASGSFGSVNKFKDEIAVELCALLAFSAIRNNDRVGMIIFTSGVEKFIPPKKGKNHVLRVIRELLYFKPQKKGTDIGEAIAFLNRVQTKKAVVFVVSDFAARNFEAPLRVASRRHDVIAITLSDPREQAMVDIGLAEIEDPETGETLLVDSSSAEFRAAFARETVRVRGTLQSFFRGAGIDEIPITTDHDYVDPLVRFFRRRERQLA